MDSPFDARAFRLSLHVVFDVTCYVSWTCSPAVWPAKPSAFPAGGRIPRGMGGVRSKLVHSFPEGLPV